MPTWHLWPQAWTSRSKGSNLNQPEPDCPETKGEQSERSQTGIPTPLLALMPILQAYEQRTWSPTGQSFFTCRLFLWDYRSIAGENGASLKEIPCLREVE